jgi:2'-5' RNA ligase
MPASARLSQAFAMLRLFVGLAIPPAFATRLTMLQGGIPGIRWTPPEALHVTLRFIGEQDEGRAADIDAALSRVAAPSFALWFEGAGEFGTKRRPSLVWAGVRRDPALTALHDKIDRALVAAGLPPDDRNFHPHVTLGRLRESASVRVGRWIEQHAPFLAGPLPVPAFHLYVSHRGHDHAVYEAVRSYSLSA